MKYILLLILTLLSVYAAAEAVADSTKWKEWWKKRPLRGLGFWVALLLSGLTMYCTWKDDNEANTRIQAQTDLLRKQERLMFEQSRIIGSISFNTRTSFEGKQRFLNCFRNLARVAKFCVDGAHFEGLICEDGVAIYWFNASTEEMMGFHFFTNSELNRILAGLPDDSHLVGEDGVVQAQESSVLGIAMKESLFRKTPARGTMPLDREIAYSRIEEEMRILFRYVFRAESIKLSDLFNENGGLSGDKYLMFQYYVNPFDPDPHLRTVSDIIVSEVFLDSLYDVPMSDFSQKVIAHFRSRGIEPKLRIKDIKILNQKSEASQSKASFPFGIQKNGGLK